MPYDILMETYLGVGLLADRPAAPNVAPGAGALWNAMAQRLELVPIL